jgi:hypothetical protein
MDTQEYDDRELPSASERVAKFRLEVRHVPLAALVEAGILAVDGQAGEVRAGRRFAGRWDELSGEYR